MSWPTFRQARDLAGDVFPVSEAVILDTARKHGIGRKMGRAICSRPDDVERLYEALPCPSSSSAVHARPSGSSAAPSAESALRKALALTSPTAPAPRKSGRSAKREILAASIYGRRAVATFAEAAVSYLENGGNKRFLAPILNHFGTTPLAQIDQLALDRARPQALPEGLAGDPQPAVLHAGVRRPAPRRPPRAVPAARHRAPARRAGARPLAHARRGRPADRGLRRSHAAARPVPALHRRAGRRGPVARLARRRPHTGARHVPQDQERRGARRAACTRASSRRSPTSRTARARCSAPARRRALRAAEAATTTRPPARGSRPASAAPCRRAGITDFHPHDCRHTWATWHYAANRDLGALMRLGGWKIERMVMRYAHVNVGELADTIDRLPGGILGDGKIGKGENIVIAATCYARRPTALGKGEVDSSILSGSTILPSRSPLG